MAHSETLLSLHLYVARTQEAWPFLTVFCFGLSSACDNAYSGCFGGICLNLPLQPTPVHAPSYQVGVWFDTSLSIVWLV